jgi:hypothetical protein
MIGLTEEAIKQNSSPHLGRKYFVNHGNPSQPKLILLILAYPIHSYYKLIPARIHLLYINKSTSGLLWTGDDEKRTPPSPAIRAWTRQVLDARENPVRRASWAFFFFFFFFFFFLFISRAFSSSLNNLNCPHVSLLAYLVPFFFPLAPLP